MSATSRSRFAAILAGSVVAAGMTIVAMATPAWAACPDVIVDPESGESRLDYSNCEEQPGGGDDGGGGADNGGGGGNAGPACEFVDIWDQFCRGESPCYIVDPANLQDDEHAREHGYPELPERPSEDDHLIFVSCLPPGGERQDQYYWASQFTEDGVSVRDRLLAAYGALVLPNVTPVFNPPTRTWVNLETWWWAQGASATPVVGSEALGLVAIAEPKEMVVSAGGQTVTCPVVTAKSDTCRMVFRRSGDFTATMRISYQVRFEMNGSPFDVPAASNDLLTMQSSDTVAVPVREIQSLVTEVD